MTDGSLHDIRVLDLSRILAGPFCTQILGDLGADIIKVERPGSGDDTRSWGPPYMTGKDGQDTTESAYYLSANRNKRSIAIDITRPEGQALIHELMARCDVLIENFKTGGLAKYGLAYDQIKDRHPHLVYCSITGFGQTGPLAQEPGYDFLAQAMSGLMAITGEPDGVPMKAGVALSDIITGLYSAIGILAALHSRERTGKGQHVDLALTDSTLAAMTNIAQYYLIAGTTAPRRGNAHATIVPYQTFETADGHVILAIGNDRQFRRFAAFAGREDWADDERFATNQNRVRHRDTLVPQIAALMKQHPTAYWVDRLHEINVPAGPVNAMDATFAHPQTKAREMEIAMAHSLADAPIALVGSPLKLSETQVRYKYPPPYLGQHSTEILEELLDKTAADIEALRENGVI